jgi:hypothetical protein
MDRPIAVIATTGSNAPENSTAGKQSIGSAEAACARLVTYAEASKPIAGPAMASTTGTIHAPTHSPHRVHRSFLPRGQRGTTSSAPLAEWLQFSADWLRRGMVVVGHPSNRGGGDRRNRSHLASLSAREHN